MDILVVGSGGREHALAWRLKQSPKVQSIFVAPGNAGTAQIAQNIPASTTPDIIEWLKNNSVDLVVVGPDNHLAEGIVDQLNDLGIAVFGPTKAAAEIEWSKSFAKRLMAEENIPTAAYRTFSELADAEAYVKTQTFPLVIKASGLAFGKGVVIAQNLSEADEALGKIMETRFFGDSGSEVVIEEYLVGKEISVHAFCDGNTAILFPPAQDHKRAYDNDMGPNTGGMGTIAPVLGVTEEQMNEIKERVVLPTLSALKKRGCPFKGILFPGIMLTGSGPKVIEFNARFGDPETQSYMRLLKSDLVDTLLACIDETLSETTITWSSKYACCVVCASGGYPDGHENGNAITGLDKIQSDTVVFHAGTKLTDEKVVTNGGRVLGVTAVGDTLKTSLAEAYAAVETISFAGKQYRKDIGAKSL